MKTYSVTFSEPVAYTYVGDYFNQETRHWEEKEFTDMIISKTFHSLAAAKKLIKANIDKYVSSSITKTWSNGDWENLGEIQLSGTNKHFIANTRMKKANY